MNITRMGMWLFIASEAVFFTLLILAYLFFNAHPIPGPTAAQVLTPVMTGWFSVALLSSSATMWGAGRSLRQGRSGALRFWLAATILLGLVFLFGQSLEWRGLILRGATISRNLFGTTFFTLTGFHGMHVFVGLIMMSVLLFLAFAGDFRQSRTAGSLEVISLYWHFVDVVWIVIFSVIYMRLIL